MLFLNNAFTKDITEYNGEVLKEVKTVDGKIYLSNGAIIKEGVVGKFFDIATNDKYGTVFEADGPDEIVRVFREHRTEHRSRLVHRVLQRT